MIFRAVTVLALLLMSAGCQRPESEVVVYVSVDESLAREVLAMFTRKTGIAVRFVGDTEATKTTGLARRLLREKSAPVADVFWSSEPYMTIDLAGAGVFTAHRGSLGDAWPARWKDADARWFAFSPRPRVIVFDPERIAPADVPGSIEALASPLDLGVVAFADPRFGTTGGHLAAIQTVFSDSGGEDGYQAWLEGVKAGGVLVLPGGNAAVVEHVATGEAALGVTDADDVHAGRGRGWNVEMIVPTHGPHGGMVTPNTVAMVAGASHPAGAAALVEFLLSDEVAQMLASSPSRNIPLQQSVADRFPELVLDDVMTLNHRRVAEARGPAIDRAVTTWMGSGSDG